MSFFKGSNHNKAVDDSTQVVHDFNRRPPFWGYRTVAYREYQPLSGLKDELDTYIQALFAGDIDEFNANALDDLILDRVKQAVADLRAQRIQHIDAIFSFGIRAGGDYTAFSMELSRLREDLKANLARQGQVREQMRLSSKDKKEVNHHA